MNVLRSVLVPLCAALCAAVAAHFAIDVAGDYLLPHDTFDDVAHGSRSVAALAALALGGAVVCGALWAALREARGSDDAFCGTIARLLPRQFWLFAGSVAVASVGLVAAMEGFDVASAGHDTGDAVDLVGGSLALGSTLTLLSSLIASILAWRVVGLLARKRRTFVAFAIVLLRRRITNTAPTPIARRNGRRIAPRAVASRRVRAGRAPPASLIATTVTIS